MAAALEPASPAVPTAAADKQHYDYDDQKSCGVHAVLLMAYERDRGPSQSEKIKKVHPWSQRPLIEAASLELVVLQNGLLSFYVAGGTPINDLVKQWKRH